jgi:hypothetical protein
MDEQLDFGAETRRTRQNGAARERLLVAGEVAVMLPITTGWVYTQARAGRMGCVRLGRYYAIASRRSRRGSRRSSADEAKGHRSRL